MTAVELFDEKSNIFYYRTSHKPTKCFASRQFIEELYNSFDILPPPSGLNTVFNGIRLYMVPEMEHMELEFTL